MGKPAECNFAVAIAPLSVLVALSAAVTMSKFLVSVDSNDTYKQMVMDAPPNTLCVVGAPAG